MVTYANFWKRAAAFLLDGFLCSVILVFCFLICAVILILFRYFGALKDISVSSDSWVGYILVLPVWLIYYVWAESSSWQATLGKKLFSLKVVDSAGNRVSFGRSLGRNFGMVFLSHAILGINYLFCLWTEKRQCLHDMIAGCLVVDTQPNEKNGLAIAITLLIPCVLISLPLLIVILFMQVLSR